MTELRMEAYKTLAADLGPENPLPVFRDAEENTKFDLAPNVPEDDKKYMGWKTAYRVLPYRMQDGYNRKKVPREFPGIVLENEILRATFLPGFDGRLASLVHKPENRELLDHNPVFQPANLALRGAWVSGGIEWNTTLVGHYYLTLSPVFAARLTAPEGYPVLRIYEWDRVKCFPWQIDFHLPPGSPFLFARVRLVNPHDAEIAMYWWTNIAVEEKPGARVLFPADTAIGFCGDSGLGLIDVPTMAGVDASYGTNVPFAQEMFSRIDAAQRRWIAHLDGSGRGLFEASTDRLQGRKLFCWGMNPGGRRWQEFLSVPGRAYLEIQAGLARTQLENLPMPARTEWTWTEAFGLLEADPEKVHSKNWAEAWHTADAAIEAILPRARVEALDAQFAATAERAPDEILFRGAGWGALERRRLARQGQPDRIPPAFLFDAGSMGPDQAPWITLLETGALPARNPAEDPGENMVQPEWRALLEEALRAKHGDHWLAWLHLGIMRLEALDAAGAREAWERSVALCPLGWALRNLAILEKRAGHADAARDLLRRAWECGPRVLPLALEYAHAVAEAKDYALLRQFTESLPEDIRGHERLLILRAKAALETGNLDEVDPVFDFDFATVREGEVTLTDIWFDVHEKRLAAREHQPVDDELRARVRREFPPPSRIDFRIARDLK